MPEKKKLSLKDLKVESFITELSNPNTVKGGITYNCTGTCWQNCNETTYVTPVNTIC
jgi:hypothetical protein